MQLEEPISSYEMCRGLLVPMYAPRATEEVLYGKQGTSLRTAIGVSPMCRAARCCCDGWPCRHPAASRQHQIKQVPTRRDVLCAAG